MQISKDKWPHCRDHRVSFRHLREITWSAQYDPPAKGRPQGRGGSLEIGGPVPSLAPPQPGNSGQVAFLSGLPPALLSWSREVWGGGLCRSKAEESVPQGERTLSTGPPPSLWVLAGPQAHCSGGEEPQPRWEGQASLIPVGLDIGEGVWCWSGPWLDRA